ncbi:chorismate mutase [Kitasatospora sp. NBC_01539]|jgi:chorismate mutase|uniref:chorismate mutase n=1 Tax=Kitasatospora sp. NBC_01539 TaxID=2903577 RepID=UPI0038600B69
MRAVRGAIQVDRDDPGEVMEATRLLLEEIMAANSLVHDDLVSIFFTATPDLRSGFPARAARDLGLTDVPLMCAQELDIDGGLPRTVRVLVTAETPLPRDRVRHVYLGGARALRPDLTDRMAGAR